MRLDWGILLLALSLGGWNSCSASAQGRLRPPDFVTCDRNHLTSFTGTVTTLTRDADATTLQVETDEDTKERFTLRHPGTDVSAWFFIGGKPFTAPDWMLITPKGTLRAKARATVWVCDDGSNPKIDWARPDPGPP